MSSLHIRSDALYKEGRRLVAPLMGAPGAQLVKSTIKICQQNHRKHFQALQALVRRFEPDFIFPMMDLSVEANALGLQALFPEDDSATIQPAKDLDSLLKRVPEIDITSDSRALSCIKTIRAMHRSLADSVLIGAYVSGPFTLAGQIMDVSEAVLCAVTNPKKLHLLITTILPVILEYAKMQIQAGAKMLCILEPSAALLSPQQFKEFSADYIRPVVKMTDELGVDSIYHVCGNTMHLYREMASSGVSALSLDSREAGVNLSQVALNLSTDTLLIGNMNPTGKLLHGLPAEVNKETEALLAEMSAFPNFVLSSGCDLPRDTPLENIAAFMETGKNYRIK